MFALKKYQLATLSVLQIYLEVARTIGARRAFDETGKVGVKEPRKYLLKGGTVIGAGPDEIQIERSLPHGHVAAALGTIRRIALDRLILSTTKDQAARRHCDLVVAMIVDRLI